MEAQAGSFRYEARQAFNVDERIVSFFEPDTHISTQYFGNLHRKTLLESERRLMLAILEDAINCYQDNLLAKRSDWIFSFKNICETLEFDPEYVRRGLLRWKEKKTAKCSHSNYWERK